MSATTADIYRVAYKFSQGNRVLVSHGIAPRWVCDRVIVAFGHAVFRRHLSSSSPADLGRRSADRHEIIGQYLENWSSIALQALAYTLDGFNFGVVGCNRIG